MPKIIIPETINIDELPGIWSPVQWEISPEEEIEELESQATASLLWSIDTPEAILRLLLDELQIERAYQPPEGYNAALQGEWESDLVTFKFKRKVSLVTSERDEDYLYVEYDVEDVGNWAIEIEPENVNISRIK